MPMISQLLPAAPTTSGDLIPISQAGTTAAASLGNVLAGVQPAIIVPTGDLLGRNSLGPGGPEPVSIGAGLALGTGTLVALGVSGAPAANTISSTDLVGISQSGTDHAISYASFLDGLTIDLAQAAAPAANSDTLWVAQNSSTMVRQTFSAVWAWIATQMPGYKWPTVEISTNTTLDGIVHNGRVLICSQPITLGSAFINMGNGFYCRVINLSNGSVILGPGITTSTGIPVLLPGQYADISGITYSGGNIVYAGLSTSIIAPPNAVSGLTASTISSTAISLTWVAPASGASPASYTVQYRASRTTGWSTAANGIIGPSYTVSGLSASTSYDFEVIGVGAGGAGVASATVTATTVATGGIVTSITWNVAPSGSYIHASGNIGVNAHVSPATAPVRFGFGLSSALAPATWVVATLVNSDLWGAYVPVPVATGTWYAWCEGTDGSAPTVFPTSFTVI